MLPWTGGRDLNTADVVIMRANGTGERLVTRTELYDSYPDWGPTSCGTATDFDSARTEPALAYRARLRGGRGLTDPA